MKKLSQQIIELRIKGHSYNDIASFLNCTKSNVSYICNKYIKDNQKIREALIETAIARISPEWQRKARLAADIFHKAKREKCFAHWISVLSSYNNQAYSFFYLSHNILCLYSLSTKPILRRCNMLALRTLDPFSFVDNMFSDNDWRVVPEKDSVILEYPAPGLSKDSFEISVHDNKVVVDIKAPENHYWAKASKFKYTNKSLDFDTLQASYEQGILRLTIQNKETQASNKVRVIEIT